MKDTKTIIQVRDLKKDFHVGEITVHALKGINLEIKEGEFVAIMGTSGSGKSTMLNILGCLDKPTNGQYVLDGVSMGELGKNELAALRNNKLGFVFQAYNLLPRTTALENVELPLFYNSKVKARERKERAVAALEAVGLADRMHHMPNQLSGGQQQRVAVARAVVANPHLILADEPTGNLDSAHGEEVMNLLASLNQNGTTIIMVTHSQRDAEYAQRIIRLFDGQIINENIKAGKTEMNAI